jgi:Leucine-rich repeat (LRR) protein
MDADTIFCILNWLSLSDLLNCSSINKQFNAISKSELIWKNISESIYPEIINNYYENYRKYNILDKFLKNHGQDINSDVLRLSHRGVFSVVPEIGLLTKLQMLLLNGNSLRFIPNEISLLTNLTHLTISHNDIESLSFDIGSLTKLRKLYMYENRLQSISSEISLLTNLFH